MPILFGAEEEQLYQVEEKLQNKVFSDSDSEESLNSQKTELKSKAIKSRLRVKI